MLWDLFCRVVDHYGDVGVCWRLARDLASRGESVRLWLDDASALAWMAPEGHERVELRAWPDDSVEAALLPPPGEVVVEAFGCDPPAPFVAAMRRERPPVWIDLEYLSAEGYVERSHGLASPQQVGPGAGLVKWFFYPGFGAGTGGLLREPGLLAARQAFDRDAWLADHGIARRDGESVITLYAYGGAPVESLLKTTWADQSTLLLACGPSSHPVRAEPFDIAQDRPGEGPRALHPGFDKLSPNGSRLHTLFVPFLSQSDYDRLLWSADLNCVRGEDSFVRAQWAGAPFLWHIYPQSDGAHAAKLDAFLDRFLRDAAEDLARNVRALFRAWNGMAPWPAALPDAAAWRSHCRRWRERLAERQDLTSGLQAFVASRR